MTSAESMLAEATHSLRREDLSFTSRASSGEGSVDSIELDFLRMVGVEGQRGPSRRTRLEPYVAPINRPRRYHCSKDLGNEVEGHLAGWKSFEEPEGDGCGSATVSHLGERQSEQQRLTVARGQVTTRSARRDDDSDCVQAERSAVAQRGRRGERIEPLTDDTHPVGDTDSEQVSIALFLDSRGGEEGRTGADTEEDLWRRISVSKSSEVSLIPHANVHAHKRRLPKTQQSLQNRRRKPSAWLVPASGWPGSRAVASTLALLPPLTLHGQGGPARLPVDEPLRGSSLRSSVVHSAGLEDVGNLQVAKGGRSASERAAEGAVVGTYTRLDISSSAVQVRAFGLHGV